MLAEDVRRESGEIHALPSETHKLGDDSSSERVLPTIAQASESSSPTSKDCVQATEEEKCAATPTEIRDGLVLDGPKNTLAEGETTAGFFKAMEANLKSNVSQPETQLDEVLLNGETTADFFKAIKKNISISGRVPTPPLSNDGRKAREGFSSPGRRMRSLHTCRTEGGSGTGSSSEGSDRKAANCIAQQLLQHFQQNFGELQQTRAKGVGISAKLATGAALLTEKSSKPSEQQTFDFLRRMKENAKKKYGSVENAEKLVFIEGAPRVSGGLAARQAAAKHAAQGSGHKRERANSR
jgi:hypothetical protein